ncbi:coiled-coil domain-containing protein 69, partial [Alligator sinensis]|uniref:Coiled-coil domain-containing protein 69 n=1 Tax=Alligator sinensis TaxID=38654 RepID=A0A3Q0GF27_ALLSI
TDLLPGYRCPQGKERLRVQRSEGWAASGPCRTESSSWKFPGRADVVSEDKTPLTHVCWAQPGPELDPLSHVLACAVLSRARPGSSETQSHVAVQAGPDPVLCPFAAAANHCFYSGYGNASQSDTCGFPKWPVASEKHPGTCTPSQPSPGSEHLPAARGCASCLHGQVGCSLLSSAGNGGRRPKSPRAKGAASQELTASKKAKAPLPEDVQKEKAALLEEQRSPAKKLPRGQQEDGERWRGKAATQAERLTQGVGSQVPGQSDVEHELQLDALKRQHAEALQDLQQTHDQEKLLLTESYQQTQASLQEMIEKLNSQLKSFQERMKRVEESILSRDYKKHLQDYGSPSQFWEQELESLHFVIEMKNERIHQLDKKLLNLDLWWKGTCSWKRR